MYHHLKDHRFHVILVLLQSSNSEAQQSEGRAKKGKF